jgi:hypothetical protein
MVKFNSSFIKKIYILLVGRVCYIIMCRRVLVLCSVNSFGIEKSEEKNLGTFHSPSRGVTDM